MRDPIELEVFKNIYHSIAEEMGAALRRTSFSPNIKERRDYSCAVFDSRGQVIAMGDHMPVHLGSMPMSVAAAIEQCKLNHSPLEPGDVVMLNDPFRGGTHLPDITLVMPVYAQDDGSRPRHRKTKSRNHSTAPDFYVASRAHHADVGGTYAGSMGPCREIYQEGLRIPPVKIMRGGKIVPDILALLLDQCPHARRARRRPRRSNCRLPNWSPAPPRNLRPLWSRPHPESRTPTSSNIPRNSCEPSSRPCRPASTKPKISSTTTASIPNPSASPSPSASLEPPPRPRPPDIHNDIENREAEAISIAIVTIDFTGSDPQVQGAVNAVEAITYSACFYVFRCLLRDDVPAAAGLMRPIHVTAPLGSVVNARPPAAVAGGNVETSQRIVDVLLKALAQAIPDRIPAAAAGTMNNLTIGGIDSRGSNPRTDQPFAYYETIAGGMGARPSKNGVSGVHTHMTNSLNTPAEALENAYPVRLRQYSLRPNSGGVGLHNGGDGIVREIEVLTDAQVTLLADRRTRGPYGLAGGNDGAPGRTTIIRRDGSEEEIPGKTSTRLRSGERIRIESPGGGGWGEPPKP